jgi:hypothetical protein
LKIKGEIKEKLIFLFFYIFIPIFIDEFKNIFYNFDMTPKVIGGKKGNRQINLLEVDCKILNEGGKRIAVLKKAPIPLMTCETILEKKTLHYNVSEICGDKIVIEL